MICRQLRPDIAYPLLTMLLVLYGSQLLFLVLATLRKMESDGHSYNAAANYSAQLKSAFDETDETAAETTMPVQLIRTHMSAVQAADSQRGLAEVTTSWTLLNKHNLNLSCKFNDKPICCEAVTERTRIKDAAIGRMRGIGKGFGDEHIQSLQLTRRAQKVLQHRHCTIHRRYVPSTYEQHHFNESMRLLAITDRSVRREALLEFIRSQNEINKCKQWVKLIREHMRSERVPSMTREGSRLLSHFEVTRTCFKFPTQGDVRSRRRLPQVATYGESRQHPSGRKPADIYHTAHENTTWIEWIEPITIYGRNPFTFFQSHLPEAIADEEKTDLLNADFVLLQSGAMLYHRMVPNYGQQWGLPTQHLLLDAGSASFDSSLYWFCCGYSQRGVSFDRIFGWEILNFNSKEFWAAVPPKWRPYYSFYNTPISSNVTHADSPIRFIKDLATEDDFVAFKLDVDNSDIETATAMLLLEDPEATKLIDEFFFELHYDCELMEQWWGRPANMKVGKLVLDRFHTMEFFQKLRWAGIRSHYWP